MKVFYTIRIVITLILLIACSTFGIWSSLIFMEMVDRLNERLPTKEQFGVLWWGPFKGWKFLEQYKREFPNDRLRRRMWLFTGIMFISLLGIALDWGLFR
jgi:hypothetical protein